MKPLFVAVLAITGLPMATFAQPPASPYAITVTPLEGKIRVEVGGHLFTEYVTTGASRPYCYPILAPDGTPLTRNFPMKDVPGEDRDHPWHKALFFAHSMVNGVDFWNEGSGDIGRSPKAKGHVVQSALVRTASGDGRLTGPGGVIAVRDNWLAPDGRVICTDDRTLHFHADAAGRFIDLEISVHAPADAPLVFGDNKDGSMAIRLAQWMTLPHKYKTTRTGGEGHIVDAAGHRDNSVWGRRAEWCDYYAPHDGRVYGVAILDHPENLRHPTWWMARDYGLFGANPFGWHDFEHLPDAHAGDYTVPAGGTLTLRYRFFFHLGDTADAHVEREYARYVRP